MRDSVQIETVYLNSMKVAFKDAITGEFMREHLKLDIENDPFTGNLIRRFTTYVRTHNLPPETLAETDSMTCHRPASWWQAWKHEVAAQRWALRWIVRWWPVRTATERHTLTVTFDLRRFRVYPDAPNIGHMHGYAISYVNHTRDRFMEWITDGYGPEDD